MQFAAFLDDNKSMHTTLSYVYLSASLLIHQCSDAVGLNHKVTKKIHTAQILTSNLREVFVTAGAVTIQAARSSKYITARHKTESKQSINFHTSGYSTTEEHGKVSG